jgi:hypothetical protein
MHPVLSAANTTILVTNKSTLLYWRSVITMWNLSHHAIVQVHDTPSLNRFILIQVSQIFFFVFLFFESPFICKLYKYI